jgi:hypothetical protein
MPDRKLHKTDVTRDWQDDRSPSEVTQDCTHPDECQLLREIDKHDSSENVVEQPPNKIDRLDKRQFQSENDNGQLLSSTEGHVVSMSDELWQLPSANGRLVAVEQMPSESDSKLPEEVVNLHASFLPAELVNMHAPFLPAELVNLLDPIPPAVCNSVQQPEVLEADRGGEVGETVPTIGAILIPEGIQDGGGTQPILDSDVCEEGVRETVPAMEAAQSCNRAEVFLDRGQDQRSERVRAASDIEVTRVNQDGG